MEIQEKSVEAAWKAALKCVLSSGKDFLDKDGRTCREVLNLIVHVSDVGDVTKPIEIINSLGTWVYPPLEELEALTMSRKDIPGYYYNYGARVFNFNAVNQIDSYVIPLLRSDPSSRRAIVVFYDPVKDSNLVKRDIPSMIMAGFAIRNDVLHANILIRSNDLFFGWPANVYQIKTWQSYIAGALGCPVGPVSVVSISAHIFSDQVEFIERVLGKRES